MTNKKNRKIGIIGGGPSGLTAAITAANIVSSKKELGMWSIDLIEGEPEVGRKLLATGNGKCNISNSKAEGVEIIKSYFNDLGILFVEDNAGRLYPHSKQAKIVRDTLLKAAQKYGVKILKDNPVTKIERKKNGFLVDLKERSTYYDRLIIATGGKAGIQYGSTGDGIIFSKNLGLNLKSVLPALVPMTYGKNKRFNLRMLKGVRSEVDLTLNIDGKEVSKENGEVQFTDYGLSGICTFNLTRYLRNAKRKDREFENVIVLIDFAPLVGKDEIKTLLNGGLVAGLNGIVNEKISRMIIDAGYDPISNSEEIAKLLKSFPINISGTKGWKEAQVTSGGVMLDEVNLKTMECKNINNLFLAGEILDYDGPSGGYNLNWAWKTGIKAGLGIIDGIDYD